MNKINIAKILLQVKNKVLSVYKKFKNALIVKREKLLKVVQENFAKAKKNAKDIEWAIGIEKVLTEVGGSDYKIAPLKKGIMVAIAGAPLILLADEIHAIAKNVGSFIVNPNLNLVSASMAGAIKIAKPLLVVVLMLMALGITIKLAIFLKRIFKVVLNNNLTILIMVGIVALISAELILLGFNAVAESIKFLKGFNGLKKQD